jgi:hypothetical protein
MHERNQPSLLQPFIAAFQWLLLSTPLGRMLVQVGGRCTHAQHLPAAVTGMSWQTQLQFG